MATRKIKEYALEVEADASILFEKMRTINELWKQGYRLIDDETLEPVYPDNVLPFKAEGRDK